MAKLIICVGIPGSGKSTWAANYQKDHPDTVIVTRDDIREEYGAIGGGWSKEKEWYVVEEMHRRIREALRAGRDVISADTNISERIRESLISIVLKCPGSECYLQVFDVDPEICIDRDSKREGHRRVGAERIRMFQEMFEAQNLKSE